MNGKEAASFTGLVDLAAASFGGKALGTSDDYFAGMENLLLPGRGVFIADKFTERGKWMDGWESRRKRGPGNDWCVLELGAPGQIFGFDIDTHHFSGNHPSYASVEGLSAPRGTPLETLLGSSWRELLGQVPLAADSQNIFGAIPNDPVSHLRLSIYPDGGVARFRVFGRVHPDWEAPVFDAPTAAHAKPGQFDLAALKNGGVVLTCSDARFGPMNNLLLPGRAVNMGGGWETRRSRPPGTDSILVQLGARGTPELVEVDTNHFKGNFPDRCSIDVVDAPGTRITALLESSAWRPLLGEVKLQADTRHFFGSALASVGAVSHVRLNIFPDGGVSRLRVWGRRNG